MVTFPALDLRRLGRGCGCRCGSLAAARGFRGRSVELFGRRAHVPHRALRLLRTLARRHSHLPGGIGQLGQSGVRVVAQQHDTARDHAAEQRQHDRGTNGPMDVQPLERGDERLQRIAEQDADDHGHEKRLCDLRRRDDGEDREHDERRLGGTAASYGGSFFDSGGHDVKTAPGAGLSTPDAVRCKLRSARSVLLVFLRFFVDLFATLLDVLASAFDSVAAGQQRE